MLLNTNGRRGRLKLTRDMMVKMSVRYVNLPAYITLNRAKLEKRFRLPIN